MVKRSEVFAWWLGADWEPFPGKHGEVVKFESPFATRDACTAFVQVRVDTKKENTKKGKATLKARGMTAPELGATRGTKDTDTLKLTCLPPVL